MPEKLSVVRVGAIVGAVLFRLGGLPAEAGERSWMVRGEFESVVPSPLPDRPATVVLRLEGDRRVELPMESLSEEDREWVAKQSTGGVTSKRTLAASSSDDEIDELIEDVESDAAACRSAADAVNVYRLALSSGTLSPRQLEAATLRLHHWRGLAGEGRVRLGGDWVSPEAVEASSRESNALVDQAIELMRIGNAKLARETFEKAGRVGRENLRSEFLLSLMPLAQKPADYDRAASQLADLVRRYPDNGFLANDLAVCEIMARRPAPAHAHFRQSIDFLADGRAVADNVGLVVANANKPRSPVLKMPERMESEFAELYRFITQDVKLKPLSTAKELVILGLNGQTLPLSQVTAAGIATLAGSADAVRPARVESLGVLVAPGRIIADRGMFSAGDLVTIRHPANAESQLPATVLATLDAPAVCLLACDGLVETDKNLPGVAPLPLAPTLSAASGDLVIVGRRPAPLMTVASTPVQAAIVTEAEGDGDTFIHSGVVPRGLGGGPIVDAKGRLVGITARTPRTDATGNVRGLGIPVERLWPMLKQSIASLEPAADEEGGLAPEDVTRKALAATVTVVAKAGPSPPPNK